MVEAQDGEEQETTISINDTNQLNNEELQHDRYRIALYYCYIPISNVVEHQEFHHNHCIRLSLLGRIRVAPEGINGVLSGYWQDLKEYEQYLQQELIQIHFKNPQPPQHSTSLSSSLSSSSLLLPELDVKYCHLRPDLPVKMQRFDSLSVQITKTVVSLVGTWDATATTDRPITLSLKSNRRGRGRKSKIRLPPPAPPPPPPPLEAPNKAVAKTTTTTTMDKEVSLARYTEQIYAHGLETKQPAQHLSPQEWDDRLEQFQQQQQQQQQQESSSSFYLESKAILLDCRNVYESSVGFFRAAGVDTLLTNTRKYAELPQVLVEHADRLAQAEHIFMYCTGGVRCERASIFLQSLLEEKMSSRSNSNSGNNNINKTKPCPQIYQLHGGIQKYLEAKAKANYDNKNPKKPPTFSSSSSTSSSSSSYLFQGKNFVFDPRRTDPVHGNQVVGQCLVCRVPHDDFDNGHAPSENREARCWKCRVLVLVCNECRGKVSCWNEHKHKKKEEEEDEEHHFDLPRVYCGGVEGPCHHTPPIQIILGSGADDGSHCCPLQPQTTTSTTTKEDDMKDDMR